MNINEIKSLLDKTPIEGVRGIVEKQYAPADQTEMDLKFGQHRQSFLIVGDTGEKLMVTLMKSQIHILDSIEGKELKLTSARDENGEFRGLILNKWKNGNFDKCALKVYPDATIRVSSPSGGEATTKAAAKDKAAGTQGAHSGDAHYDPCKTKFGQELALAAYGYCLCLDKSEQIVSDRILLKSDPESVRAIATNLWMSSKHHLHTLAPWLNEQEKQEEQPKAKSDNSKKSGSDSKTLVSRVIKGALMRAEGMLTDDQSKVLDEMVEAIDRDGLWDTAYDQFRDLICKQLEKRGFDQTSLSAAFDRTYDHFSSQHLPDNMSVEKFLVLNQNDFNKTLDTKLAEITEK